MSLVVICKILGLFVNILTADDNCSVLNRFNFLRSRSNFQYFENKDDPHSFCISEIMDCERHG